ncbi:hypothetical protein [Reyranella sp.]|uniref:hypothetical protein n=1 Tax=Reyranella sp. TaxID=1929291 RepID=UPI0040352143
MSLINDQLEDPLLKQIEADISNSLTPSNRADYEAAVLASPQGAEGLRVLANADDKAEACALRSVTAALMLYKQNDGTTPLEVVPPAAATLMLLAMDTLQKANLYTPSKEDVARGAGIQLEQVMAALGLTVPVFTRMAEKTSSIAGSPEALEKINRSRAPTGDLRLDVLTGPQGLPN